MESPEPDPRTWLPLTPLVFQVLLALADEPRHGYGVIREIDARTGGRMRLRTGTLYLLLQRMAARRLIETCAVPGGADVDERRQYYTLTALGRGVVRAEAQRLEALVADARRKHVLARTRKA